MFQQFSFHLVDQLKTSSFGRKKIKSTKISHWIHASSKALILSWRRFCGIETSPLICSVNQWTGFCIIGTSVMKDSRRPSFAYTESLFLHVAKHDLLFVLSAFLSRIFMIHRTAAKRGDYLLISFLPLPPLSQTLRH